MPPTDSVDNFEYPNFFESLGVGSWKYNVAIKYQSVDEITKSQVTELRWYKNVGSLEHEYIVATCRGADNVDVYLRLERRPADPNFSPEQALPREVIENFTPEERRQFNADIATERARKTLNRAVWNSMQKSTPKLKDELMSDDSVTRVDSPIGSLEDQARLIACYQGFQRPFYIRDLAFLAAGINEHKPGYQLFVYQCYWYARTLVSTAVSIYSPATEIEPADDFKRAGTYTVKTRIVVVNEHCQGEVDAIKSKFDKSIIDNDVKVRRQYDEWHGKMQRIEEEKAALQVQVRSLQAQLNSVGHGSRTILPIKIGAEDAETSEQGAFQSS